MGKRLIVVKTMCLLSAFFFLAQALNAQKALHYKEYAFLELPDPPYDGYVTSAWWNKSSEYITFDKTSEVGATVYLNHYFEGTELVTCEYVFTYIGTYDGHYHAARGSHTFVLSFASGQATLSNDIIKLAVGHSQTLSCKISTGGYSNPNAEWKSSNENVATVSSGGKVTGLAVGETYITVDPIVCPPLRCHVFVVSPTLPTEIRITPEKIYLQEGASKTLSYKFIPEDSYSKVTWSTSNASVATVSSDGLVFAVCEGEAVITATTENGKVASATVVVTPQPRSVLIRDAGTYVGYSMRLVPLLEPQYSETSYKWKISDTSVATVDKYGNLTGIKEGRTTVTVTTSNKLSSTANVTVTKVPDGMSTSDVRAKLSVVKSFVNKTIENIKK